MPTEETSEHIERDGMSANGWTQKDFEAVGGCGCVIVILLIVTALASVQALGGLNIQYSDGSRSGIVTKISKKGMIWQTWEGELDLGRLRSTGGDHPTMTADIFYFSVASDEVASQILEAERRGTRATLNYKQYLVRGFRYGKTPYDITSVGVSEERPKQPSSETIR